MKRPPATEQVQVNFRMPADLKARIEQAAEANGRTTTKEIVATLEEKYPLPAHPTDRLVVRMFQLLALLPDEKLEAFSDEIRESMEIDGTDFAAEFDALKDLILSARKDHGGPLPEDQVMDFLRQFSLKDALPEDAPR